MAYEGREDLYSMAPPAAPLPAMLTRRARGRLGGQGHLGALAKLHPDHPIFRVMPGLRNMMNRRGGPPDPGPGPDPFGRDPQPFVRRPRPFVRRPQPGTDNYPDPFGGDPQPIGRDPQPGTDNYPQPSGGDPQPGTGYPPAAEDYSGLNQWGAPPAAVDRPRDIRGLLMERYHTAGPQQPALTSRAAMMQFLQKQQQQRHGGGRKPMLPSRRHRAY